MAGTGKSTIARTVAQSYHSQNTLGASFFFSRGTGDLGTAHKFVSTLEHQLAAVSPSLKGNICRAIAARPDIALLGLRDQWNELIIQPLLTPGQQNSALSLVIDALDECEPEEDVKLILQLFVEAKKIHTINFGVFITSRPEIAIRFCFRSMPEIAHRDLSLHDIPRSIVEHDIFLFLEHELSQVGRMHDLEQWPGKEILDKLLEASVCLFIYAATVCRFIGDPKWLPEQRIDLVLSDRSKSGRSLTKLDEMYTQILKYSLTNDQSEEDIVDLSQRFKHIVGAIVVLFDVIPSRALATLLSLRVKDVNICLDPLHSLLNVPQNAAAPTSLLHPSFRDFLLEPARCQDTHFWIDQQKVHESLLTDCLRVLSRSLRKDICGLKAPGTMAFDVHSRTVDQHLPKEVQYASLYWVDHLEKIVDDRRSEFGLRDNGEIHVFLLVHFLHWIEALSLLGRTTDVVLMIVKLLSMLNVGQLTSCGLPEER